MSEEGENNLLGDSVRELRKLNLNKLEQELGCNTTELTPLRSHYLKKHLISQEIDNELDVLSHPDALSLFGPPFKQSTRIPDIDIPFLKLIFREFVITFPFLKAAPDNFWSDKVQVFVKEFLERNLASTGDEEELTKRRALKMKIQKHLTVLLSSGCKIEGGEAVVKVDGSDIVANKARPPCANSYRMQVNVVTLRVPQKRSIMHNRAHEEFIIHSKLVGNDGSVQEVYVGRRYQDFKLLAQNLRNEFPDEVIPSPPQKDKSSSLAAQDAASSSSSQIDDDVSTPTSLFREKNRLTLRAYLRDLLNISRSVANSSTLQTFLLSNPIALTEEELQDAERRLFNDSVKNSGKDRFKKEMDARADEVMDSVKMFKSDISSKDGFKKMFSIIKDNETIESLPERYMKVFEWARISFASTIYQTFVGSDTSSETFGGLKRIHALMPYFVLRSMLRISNPIAMVRGVIDLFLAQPFGQRSILQRMFSASIYEDIKQLESDIELTREKVCNDVLSDRIKQFVDAPREIQELYRNDAEEENTHIINIIFRSGDMPTLSPSDLQKMARGWEAYARYEEERARNRVMYTDDGPDSEEGWLFMDLSYLLKLYTKLRDKEQLIEMIFEGVTAELLKDMVTIFYTPLAQVYKAANIVDSLYDLQMFIGDLIRTVEQVEERSQVDPAGTVHIFVDLVKRHEGQFYSFVHKVHSKGEDLFDSFGAWIERFFDFLRDGMKSKISLEMLLPHSEAERKELFKEVDGLAIYHYKKKVMHEQRMREKYIESQEDYDGKEESSEWVAGLVGSLGVDEVLTTEVTAAGENETEDEEEEEENIIYPETGKITELLPIFVEIVKNSF